MYDAAATVTYSTSVVAPTSDHPTLSNNPYGEVIAAVVCHLMSPLFSISCCQHCFVHGGLRISVTTTVAAWLESVTRVAASAIADCCRGAAIIANHHNLPL
ncbi:unnamed protein product [Lactuca saligna]|uniref:Uncharacterized protein n=1 Tax=Lactuca saligna TaxID=75948 RepID=A0AA35V3M4_LACSI|nr:unnamed protein product [Lactuca saligna]